MRKLIISTSERGVFRSCRRKFDYSSLLRKSLSPYKHPTALWFGTGIHHVLEDLHGACEYENNKEAWKDYEQATIKEYGFQNIPIDYTGLGELAVSMLDYYEFIWLDRNERDPLETYIINGIPQIEVPFEFELPFSNKQLKHIGVDKVVYKGILDRVIIDDYGKLWILDYKTCKSFANRETLEINDQIGIYLWALSHMYKRKVAGFIYMQFKKQKCNKPATLKKGNLSLRADQNTSYRYFEDELEYRYGSIDKASDKEKKYINTLKLSESDEGDKFIRRDIVTRSWGSMKHTSEKIMLEIWDMINPDLPIYPNPTFMCQSMCDFKMVCNHEEQGLDVTRQLKDDFFHRSYFERSSYTKYLKVGNNSGKEVREILGVL